MKNVSVKFHDGRFRGNGNSSFVLYSIIGINMAVYGAWEYAANDRKLTRFMHKNFTVSTVGVLNEGLVHTLFTSAFSHRNFTHILANMVTLYFFGSEALLLLGSARFLGLYMGGGLVSSVCHILWPIYTPKSWPSRYRSSRYAAGLGASGAISATVAYSILCFPTQIVYIYMVLPVPAALFGVGYLMMDTYGLYNGTSNVSNAAHLGGAAFGAFYFLLRKFRR